MTIVPIAVIPPRKSFTSPETRLAAAVLTEALRDIQRIPRSSTGHADETAANAKDAWAWLTDTVSDHVCSLRWCCAIVSLATGENLEPERVASVARAGRRLPREKRRTREGKIRISAEMLTRGKAWS